MDKEIGAANSIDNHRQTFNFLTEIYDVLKCFENNPSKLSTKINDLKSKFERARSVLGTLPGIDMSLKEQESYYETLLKQYQRESELIESYKDMCKFDVSKLESGPVESVEEAVAGSSSNNEDAIMALESEPMTETEAVKNEPV